MCMGDKWTLSLASSWDLYMQRYAPFSTNEGKFVNIIDEECLVPGPYNVVYSKSSS